MAKKLGYSIYVQAHSAALQVSRDVFPVHTGRSSVSVHMTQLIA